MDNVKEINDIWGRLTTVMTPNNTTDTYLTYGSPVFIKAQEVGETIEFIYKQKGACPTQIRVFKIVYSCIQGKWNKSAPIYGEIIPPSGETYLFKDKEV